jgi:hypothetical protein
VKAIYSINLIENKNLAKRFHKRKKAIFQWPFRKYYKL